MLDMGFEPQIRELINYLPGQRQTALYTVTRLTPCPLCSRDEHKTPGPWALGPFVFIRYSTCCACITSRCATTMACKK